MCDVYKDGPINKCQRSENSPTMILSNSIRSEPNLSHKKGMEYLQEDLDDNESI